MSREWRYKSGDWNAICDSCGKKFKASQLKRRWDGMMVCSDDYEARHPQDFLRARTDKISVPWSRPISDSYLPYLLGINESVLFTESLIKDIYPSIVDSIVAKDSLPLGDLVNITESITKVWNESIMESVTVSDGGISYTFSSGSVLTGSQLTDLTLG